MGTRLRWLTGLGSIALFAAGCENPPAPVPAGGFGVTLKDTGADCPLATHDADMGVVAGTGEPELVSNGQEGAEVTCAVEAASGGFKVTATLDADANVRISVPVLSPDNVDEASGADGSLTYASTNTGGDVFASAQATPCKFFIDEAAGQFVRAGEAWFTVTCDALESEGNVCGLAQSYIALRNCIGTVPADD